MSIDPTNVVLAISAVGSAFGVPIVSARLRRRAAEAAADEERDKNSDVSWVNINRAIVAERDNLQKQLNRQNAAHSEELTQMREGHRIEIGDMRVQLATCQKTVDDLYRELAVLRRPP